MRRRKLYYHNYENFFEFCFIYLYIQDKSINGIKAFKLKCIKLLMYQIKSKLFLKIENCFIFKNKFPKHMLFCFLF